MNSKYLKEGALEQMIITGVWKKTAKDLQKTLKEVAKKLKRSEKQYNELAEMAKKKAQADWIEKGELKTSIVTLRLLIARASNGLSKDKAVNTENLVPSEVRAILDEALKAWDKNETKNNDCCTGSIHSIGLSFCHK